jgi:hypothetical protein
MILKTAHGQGRLKARIQKVSSQILVAGIAGTHSFHIHKGVFLPMLLKEQEQKGILIEFNFYIFVL